jgi:hypothetical protein
VNIYQPLSQSSTAGSSERAMGLVLFSNPSHSRAVTGAKIITRHKISKFESLWSEKQDTLVVDMQVLLISLSFPFLCSTSLSFHFISFYSI